MPNVLTHSPAEIIRKVLVDLGLVTTGGANPIGAWPAYVSQEPSGTGVPDNVVTIYDTVGIDQGRSMIDGELYEHYGFQVRVRSQTHPVGWRMADAIRKALAMNVEKMVVGIDGTNYLVWCAAGIGPVLSLGKESPESNRRLFTVNAITPIAVDT